MSLSDKSDYEINCMVAKIAHPKCSVARNGDSGVMVAEFKMGRSGWLECEYARSYDWIGDAAQAFKLMISSKIGLSFCGDLLAWFSEGWEKNKFEIYDAYHASSENPNRAICECFILMNGGE